ncbi:MAG: class I SAM-dependent methyltransferase [Planctomycetota bacterium]
MSAEDRLEAERDRLRQVFRARDAAGSERRYAGDRPAVRLERRLLAAALDAIAPVPRGASVLEIGCGRGGLLPLLAARGAATLSGVDLLEERVAAARAALAPTELPLDLRVACGSALPFPDATFDLVALATVTSGIRETTLRARIAGEARRVLAPGGRILHYDLVRRGPRSAAWSPVPIAAVEELFAMPVLAARTVGLVAPLARALGPLATPLGPALARLPLLRSHALVVLGEARA